MKTTLQGLDEENRDCGLACLEMLTGRKTDYWRASLSIKTTRNTKKRELLAALRSSGFRVGPAGRLSAKTRLIDLPTSALLFGKLLIGDEKYGHWAVWDADEKVVRDPYGYRSPFRVTSYTLVSKK